MSTTDFVRAVHDTALAQTIQRADPRLIEGAQLCHVLGLTLVLATVLLLSLRLFGRVLAEVPLQRVVRALAPLWAAGLAVTVLSGSTLFLSTTMVYDANAVFWTKLTLLAAAAALQSALLLRAARPQPLRPAAAATAGAVSLLLWATVGIAGRAIGFV